MLKISNVVKLDIDCLDYVLNEKIRESSFGQYFV